MHINATSCTLELGTTIEELFNADLGMGNQWLKFEMWKLEVSLFGNLWSCAKRFKMNVPKTDQETLYNRFWAGLHVQGRNLKNKNKKMITRPRKAVHNIQIQGTMTRLYRWFHIKHLYTGTEFIIWSTQKSSCLAPQSSQSCSINITQKPHYVKGSFLGPF